MAKEDRQHVKDQTFLEMAAMLGQLGTCDRKKVGAIITYSGRCVSWGYNGAPPGALHCDLNHHGWHSSVLDKLEETHPGFKDTRDPDDPRHEEMYLMFLKLVEKRLVEYGCRNATHAEANALAFAARQGISTVGGTCYVTVSPCDVCARLLIAAGIAEVIYDEEYRDRRGVEILNGAGVTCLHRPRDGGLVGAT